jgi:hypothetical protein
MPPSAERRAHQGHGLGMAPGGMGQLGLGDRQHIVANDRRHGAMACGVGA